MPELPEVEVVRRGLAAHVVGRRVARVAVTHPRATRRHLAGSADLVDRLTGATFTGACRRGKYLWLPVAATPGAHAGSDDAPLALVIHLGMSGSLLVRAGPVSGDPAEPHLRVLIEFADGGPALWFVDPRTFGSVTLDRLVPAEPTGAAGELVPAMIAHLARDPLDPRFDDAAFTARVRRRHTVLKRALLDQTLVSGIGNIYADEALWRARLHWSVPTDRLAPATVEAVLRAVRAVFTDALAAGGTSFDQAYVDVDGRRGWFTRSLAVYGRAGQPCPRCGVPVRREPFMNRSSFFCPDCQPRPSS